MALAIMRDPVSGKNFSGVQGYRLYLYGEQSATTMSFSAPYAPKKIDYAGWRQDWTTVERPGGKPLLLRKQQPLHTMAFTITVGEQDPLASQAPALEALKVMAKTRERVYVRYSVSEAGLWRITDLTVSSEERHPVTNEITRATASLTLTEASDPAPAVGPVTGGAGGGGAPAPPAQRIHTVVRGDCLWNLAKAYYGNALRWPSIYDANRGSIRDPHWIFPGQRFVIP